MLRILNSHWVLLLLLVKLGLMVRDSLLHLDAPSSDEWLHRAAVQIHRPVGIIENSPYSAYTPYGKNDARQSYALALGLRACAVDDERC
jgi:hypothetical protein